MAEMMLDIFTVELVLAALVAALSGLVHGYTGFGAALVMVPLLSLIWGPVEAISILAISVVIGSCHAYPRVSRQAVWREIGPLVICATVFTPLGVALLFAVDPAWMRRIIGALVLLSALLIMSGWVYRGPRGALASGVAGALGGGITGLAGVGGPPMVVYFLAASVSAASQRANIILAVGATAVMAFVSLAVGGAIGVETAIRGVAISPIYTGAFWVGGWLFAKLPVRLYRSVVLWLLVITGISAMVS